MSVRDDLLARLDEAAVALGDELEHLVLVGGSALALYPLRAGTSLRPTVDVDWVVDADLVAFYRLQERLHSRGFRPVEAGPICRLRRGVLVLDVMPIDEGTLGFTNRWYPKAVATASRFRLPSGSTVRAATPLMLAASKCEAFSGRGGGDFDLMASHLMASHDLEDLFALLAGDADLRETIAAGTDETEDHLRRTLVGWMNDRDFVTAIPGHFPGDPASQEHARELIAWLRSLRPG